LRKFIKVLTPSPENAQFSAVGDIEGATHAEGGTNAEERRIPTPGILHDDASSIRTNIQLVRAAGLDVDDDSEPAPENIPEADPPPAIINNSTTWGWNGFCDRRMGKVANPTPKLNGLSGVSLAHVTFLTMWQTLAPVDFFKEVILTNINRTVNGHLVSWGEFLRWLGMWHLMASEFGSSRRDYWSVAPPDRFDGAPFRLDDIMSRNRFEAIMKAIKLTNNPPPSYRDRFWEIRDLVAAFNVHMTNVFMSGYIACLDESMSTWTNRWTCPGWMYVPRKPNPMGNEWHTICCTLSGIMFGMELVEGKDAPPERRLVDPSDVAKGKTAGLLLRLCRPLFGTGTIVILDSGFCVLQAIIELRKNGVYSSAVIKKRRYWPRYIDGDAMDERMEGRAIGDCDALHGTLDGVHYTVFLMKEQEYCMKLMSTYGGLIVLEQQQDTFRSIDGRTLQFKYKEPFANHYLARHAVDDHNNLRQGKISIEETWRTHRWEFRVFAFILGIIEVNVYNAFRYFVWNKQNKSASPNDFISFRKQLAKAMIYNEYLVPVSQEQRARTRQSSQHILETAPKHARKYTTTGWILGSKKPYQQYGCRHPGCKKMIRTYCSCSKEVWMCSDCHIDHLIQVVRQEKDGGELT
jgi:Transposase IS4